MELYAICLRMDRFAARSSWNLVSSMLANASVLFSLYLKNAGSEAVKRVRSSVLAVR